MLPGASYNEPLLSPHEQHEASSSEIAQENEALVRHIYQEASEIALRTPDPIYRSDLFYNMIPDQGIWCMSMDHPLSELMEAMRLHFSQVVQIDGMTVPLIMWHHDVILFAMDILLEEFKRMNLRCTDNCAPKEEEKEAMVVVDTPDASPPPTAHGDVEMVTTSIPIAASDNASNKKQK